MLLVLSCLLLASALASCAGTRDVLPVDVRAFGPGARAVPPTLIDAASASGCSVTYDGSIRYALPAGPFPPIEIRQADCSARTTLAAEAPPPLPLWARPPSKTQSLFVATSLQEAYDPNGMALIEADASRARLPVTWMVGNSTYLSQGGLAAYDAAHGANGDDLEVEEAPSLTTAARSLSWYAPSVSVEGAGHERNVAYLTAAGDSAFWGITWNSHGTDGTSDEGAPWGAYCADPSSYKRPDPDGSCPLLSFEWTARDLTRAFFEDTNADGYSSEAAFSSDPDDVLDRGGFSSAAATAYVRALVDAYAAAGETAPLVMMSQQETADEGSHAADDPVLAALYDEASRDGMTPATLRSANAVARGFAAAPRAVAFPYLAGGRDASVDGAPFAPATIDYHDTRAGMTFVSGHTLPARIYQYAADAVSLFDRTLVPEPSSDMPSVVSTTVANGIMTLTVDAPVAQRFAIALWTDPSALPVLPANAVAAGHAGLVVPFDLPAGRSAQSFACGCTSPTFPYSR